MSPLTPWMLMWVTWQVALVSVFPPAWIMDLNDGRE